MMGPRRATAIAWMTCGDPDCGLHFVLFDKREQPFAEAILHEPDLHRIMAAINAHLSEKKANLQ